MFISRQVVIPRGPIQGLQMIRKLGRFVEFSVYNDPVTVDWSIIGDRKELDLQELTLALILTNRNSIFE